MKAHEVPQELKNIFDKRTGKVHSASSTVMQALAEILTRYEEMLGSKSL